MVQKWVFRFQIRPWFSVRITAADLAKKTGRLSYAKLGGPLLLKTPLGGLRLDPRSFLLFSTLSSVRCASATALHTEMETQALFLPPPRLIPATITRHERASAIKNFLAGPSACECLLLLTEKHCQSMLAVFRSNAIQLVCAYC